MKTPPKLGGQKLTLVLKKKKKKTYLHEMDIGS
jgi:hypothetical protein